MFLTKDQIVRMTGYKFKNMQIRWLAEHGYKFDVTAAGNPIVLEAHINERLGGTSNKLLKSPQPDFSNTSIFG